MGRCWVTVVAMCCVVRCSFAWRSGVNMYLQQSAGVTSKETFARLSEAAAIPADSVVFTVTWYQKTGQSSTILPHPKLTPLDADLKTLIRYAQSLGLQTMLRLLIGSLDDTLMYHISPSDATSWFANYSSMVSHYAQLSQDVGVDAFCIGEELAQLTKPAFSDFWVSLVIPVARKAFTGPLTYSAIFFVELARIPAKFWAALDWIGIDAYWPLASAEDRNPSFDAMLSRWQNAFQDVRNLRIAINATNKHVFLTEWGAPSFDGCLQNLAYNPTVIDCQNGTRANNTCQDTAYQVILEAISLSQDLIIGASVFWLDNPTSFDTTDPAIFPCFFSFRGKPALKTLQSWYQSEKGKWSTPEA